MAIEVIGVLQECAGMLQNVIGVEVVEWELKSTKCNFNQKREL